MGDVHGGTRARRYYRGPAATRVSRGAQEGGTRVSRGRDAGHAGEPVRCAGGGPRASPRDGLPRAEEPATMTPRGNPGRDATGEPAGRVARRVSPLRGHSIERRTEGQDVQSSCAGAVEPGALPEA